MQVVGIYLQIANPDGIWLYTPPADGSGAPSNSFGVGFSLGSIGAVALLLVLLIVSTVYKLMKKSEKWTFVVNILGASIFGILLFYVGNYISGLSPVPPYW